VVTKGVVTLLGLTHCTTEQGRIFVPVTVNEREGLPAAAVACESEASVGVARALVGVESVNGIEEDVPIEFVTVTEAAPGNAVSVAGMDAVSWVAFPKVVGCATPFQFTVESLVKFVPFTVSTKPCELQ